MKFSVRAITTSGRLGLISDVKSLPGSVFETPMMLLTTRGGTVSHLTHETLEMLGHPENLSLLLPHAGNLRTLNGIKESKMNISAFIGMQESLSVCTVNDPLTSPPEGFNNKNSVAVWTVAGKEMVEPKGYMDAIEAFQPDIYQSLSDAETTSESSKKRIQRSVKSTTEFFEYCLDRHTNSQILKNSSLLASLVGGYCVESRRLMAEEMSSKSVDGFFIEGFDVAHEKGETANMDAIIPLVAETTQVLPKEKLRVMPGCWTPEAIWQLVQEDIDVFDSSFPTLVAEGGGALTFKFDPTTKRIHYPENSGSLKYGMDMMEKEHSELFEPILQDCKCVTCVNHTRAYVHHLLCVKELLGRVLLMLHNLHHYLEFFAAIRSAIVNCK